MSSTPTLIEFLENAETDKLRRLPNEPLQSLIGLASFKNFDELRQKTIIKHNLFIQEDYDKNLLFILDKDRTLLWFKVLSGYLISLVVIFLIIFPLIVSNYWLYFFLPLILISALSTSPVKTIFKPLFWVIILTAGGYAFYSSQFEIFGMILPILALKFSTSYARKLFQKEIIQSAKNDELSFKWLYARGSVVLEDKDNGSLIYMDMK